MVLPWLVLAAGCATTASRSSSEYTHRPHVYPSTRSYLRGESPPLPYENESLDGWNVFPSPRAQCVSCLAPPYLILVDVPLSLASDTLLLPVDLCAVYRCKRHVNFFADFLREGGAIPSPQRIRSKYIPAYCDEAIRVRLAGTHTPIPLIKYEALLDAGVALPLIAQSPQTPGAVLRSLAHTNDVRLLTILAGNPSLPEDVVVSMAGDAQRPVLLCLAARERLPYEAQALIAQNDDVGVRRELVSNKSLDAEILYGMARDETQAVILNIMAALPRCEERVYGAIAAKADRNALQRLAGNEFVPDAVLSEILENADDGIARAVLNHKQASFATRTKALNAIVNKMPSDKIR